MDSEISRSFINARVLSPHETVSVIGTSDPELVRQFQLAMVRPDNSISFCYCSIFDACWLADSTKNIQKPQPVETCPDFGEEAYLN